MLRLSVARSLRQSLATQPARGRFYASGSNMHENDPEVIDKEHKRNLTGTQHQTSTPHEHAPGWNETLASESEANVQAEKSEGAPSTEKTIEYLKQKHASDASTPSQSRSGMGSTGNTRSFSTSAVSRGNPGDSKDVDHTQAAYERDTVDGPLGSSGGGKKDGKSAASSDHAKEKSKQGEKQPQAHSSNASSGAPTGSEDAVKADRGEA